jgi:copper chaperone NosL
MKAILPFVVLGAILLAGCREQEIVARPDPQDLTRDVSGFFCGMIVADHPGPKAQLHRKSNGEILWFPSVRDAIAFTLMPGEARDVAVIYVNDMTGYADWQSPPPNWVAIDSAHFVIGSDMTSGMGIGEAVPFGTLAAAQSFVTAHGGQIVDYKDIPDDYVFDLGPSDGGAS